MSRTLSFIMLSLIYFWAVGLGIIYGYMLGVKHASCPLAAATTEEGSPMEKG